MIYNVPSYWQKFSSCHACKADGNIERIPLIAYEGVTKSDATIKNFKAYTLKTTGKLTNDANLVADDYEPS